MNWKKRFRKWTIFCLCALLLISALPITAAADNYSGKLGDNISWTYNDIRHDLRIYGNGPMEDYDRTPFWGRRTEITKVIISGGVTYIGANAFNPLAKVTSAKIESGVQAVGKNAFSGTDVSSIILPDSVRSIGDRALTCCTAAVHIPRFTQDIGENILNLQSTTVYICSTTEDCYAKEYADAHGYTFKVCTHEEHTHDYTAVETTATCTQGGFTSYACTVCGDSYTDSETDALGHDFSEWQVTTDPTCTEQGERTRTCSRCGETETQPVEAAGHTYDTVATTATCTTKGVTTYTCSVCGDSYTTDETEALGHDFGEWAVTTTPTCTAQGEEIRTCSRCEAKETKPVDAAGHDYDAAVTAPTCTEKGFTTHTCSACGDSYTDSETDVLGHDFGEWSVTTTPTCTGQGEETRTCSRCDAKETKPVDAAEHDYDAAVTAPTCTEKGFTTHTCSACGDSYTDAYISALGHDWEETGRTAATCLVNGGIHYTCKRDASHTRTDILPAPGHKYAGIVTLPTCTDDGFTTHTCTVCGDTFRDSVVPASGHRYDVRVVSPACLSGGYMLYTCGVCGEQHTGSPVLPLGHTYADGVCIRCGKGEYWDYTVQGDSVTLTAYTADDPFVTVPASLGGRRVTAIADGAAAGNSQIEFVFLPDSVVTIGAEAFFGCSSLREVFIGGGVTAVGYHAFAQCESLSIVCVTAEQVDLRGNVFGANDPRFRCIVPADSNTAACLAASALRYTTYSYPLMRDDKHVIAFSGETVLYGDLEYFYWVRLAHRYPDAAFLRFERLVFDDLSPSLVGDEFSDEFVDNSAENLTLKNVYVSVQVQDETITFDRLVKLLEDGQISLAVSFDSEKGEKMTIFQKIGGMMHKVFNALTKLLNSIIRIFKKK